MIVPGPRRVLLAIDGSAAADLSVDLVAGLAWPPGTAIRVLQAVDLGPGLFGGPWPSLALTQVDRLAIALRDEARRDVEAARERLQGPGRAVTAAIVESRAATVIVDEARSLPADLVVIGSRGHGTIASMVLGSVSAEVVDHAPAPVLVARGTTIERVVLAWDGSPSAMSAAAAVQTWPILDRAAIRVVTVADAGAPWWSGFAEAAGGSAGEATMLIADMAETARTDAAHRAESMAATLRDAGRTAVADPRDGDAATAIIAAARESRADLVVVGAHGRTGLVRLALGSVSSNLVRHAPCSVLIVRESQPTDPPGDR